MVARRYIRQGTAPGISDAMEIPGVAKMTEGWPRDARKREAVLVVSAPFRLNRESVLRGTPQDFPKTTVLVGRSRRQMTSLRHFKKYPKRHSLYLDQINEQC